MGIKKFFKDVQSFLDLDFLDMDCFSKKNKKESMEKLIVKLENSKKKLKHEIKAARCKDAKKELVNKFTTINETIKKGKKYLKKYS